MKLPESKLVKDQKQFFIRYYDVSEDKVVKSNEGLSEGDYRVQVRLRYDDDCGNGHNTFSITGSIEERTANGKWRELCCGCLHDEIPKYFPEFSPLIKWHLTSSDGPMHYMANSMFHASNRDCWGKLKGEPKQWETKIFFNDVPIPYEIKNEKFILWLKDQDVNSLEIHEIAYEKSKGDSDYKYDPHYTFKGFGKKWHECPFRDRQAIEQFLKAMRTCKVEYKTEATSWGDGKEPDLEAARSSAIWPEAQLEDFTAEKLSVRLPALMEEFKKCMEDCGFTY